jgi:hypothetical protein
MHLTNFSINKHAAGFVSSDATASGAVSTQQPEEPEDWPGSMQDCVSQQQQVQRWESGTAASNSYFNTTHACRAPPSG